jgi:hypothetical protein
VDLDQGLRHRGSCNATTVSDDVFGDMSEIVTIPSNDARLPLDDALAEAIIEGTGTKDMPGPYRSLAQALGRLRAPSAACEQRGEEAAVTEMLRAVHHDHIAPPRRSPMTRKFTVKTLVIAGALTAVTAGAAAASGLPGAAQDTATAALAKIGITVPGTNDHSGDHPNSRGSSAEVRTTTTEEEATPAASLPEQADAIVAIATDSSLSGLDKGAAVSSLASDGHSRAGTEHQTPEASTGRPASTPAGTPADVPAGPPASTPAGPPADFPAGPPAETPAGPPADVPAGPPADIPAGPPASHPVTPPVEVPAAPPVSVPVQPPVEVPAGPPSGVPAGPPASLPVSPPEHP